MLELNADDMKVREPDILKGMRGQRRRPQRGRRRSRLGDEATVQGDVAISISPNKGAPTEDVEHARPGVGMDGGPGSGGDPSVQDPHGSVLEQQSVVFWGGDERVEARRPGLARRG